MDLRANTLVGLADGFFLQPEAMGDGVRQLHTEEMPHESWQ